MTRDCIETNLTTTEQDATIEKLSQLPLSHFAGLVGITGWTDQAGEITQPVTTAEIADVAQSAALPAPYQLGERAIRDVVTELETMGLVET